MPSAALPTKDWVQSPHLPARLCRPHRLFLTVIRNFAVRVFSLASVALQLTIVRPIRNRLPDRGTQVTGTRPSTASLVLTL
jgi:hypothetical protein